MCLYPPNRRALKPEAQAKESPRFPSLARFDVAHLGDELRFAKGELHRSLGQGPRNTSYFGAFGRRPYSHRSVAMN